MNKLDPNKRPVDFFKANKINRFFRPGSLISANREFGQSLGLEALILCDRDILSIKDLLDLTDWVGIKRYNKWKWLRAIKRNNKQKPTWGKAGRQNAASKFESGRENLKLTGVNVLTVLGRPKKIFHVGTSWFFGHPIGGKKIAKNNKPAHYVVPVLFVNRKYLLVLPLKKDPRIIFRKIL